MGGERPPPLPRAPGGERSPPGATSSGPGPGPDPGPGGRGFCSVLHEPASVGPANETRPCRERGRPPVPELAVTACLFSADEIWQYFSKFGYLKKCSLPFVSMSPLPCSANGFTGVCQQELSLLRQEGREQRQRLVLVFAGLSGRVYSSDISQSSVKLSRSLGFGQCFSFSKCLSLLL